MSSKFPLSARISAFVQLGERLLSLDEAEKNSLFLRAQNQNAWFTFRSLAQAMEGIRLLLSEEALTQWVKAYPITDPETPKAIGLLMAGNIPAVGFHDLLAVLMRNATTMHRAGHLGVLIATASMTDRADLWDGSMEIEYLMPLADR